MSRLSEADCIIICVPTPLTESREPDLTYIEGTARSIANDAAPGQLVVLESTTYPDDDPRRRPAHPRGDRPEVRARTSSSPSAPSAKIPGNPSFQAATIPKVVGGFDDASAELACAMYGQAVVEGRPVSSMEVAEACKILENTYRAVNIALVNELKVLYDRWASTSGR